jgi:hypothetical protein
MVSSGANNLIIRVSLGCPFPYTKSGCPSEYTLLVVDNSSSEKASFTGMINSKIKNKKKIFNFNLK